MTKIGRNNPCHCGSGKKFKRCHGAHLTPATPSLQAESKLRSEETSTTIAIRGLPGVLTRLIVRPFYKEPDPRNEGDPRGSPGLYRVVFTLSRPGFSPVADRSFAFEPGLEGDSHVAIAPPAHVRADGQTVTHIQIRASLPGGEEFVFLGAPNKKGFLGKLSLEQIQANSFQDAEMRAFRALAPGLSNLSVFHDVPLHIYQIDIAELRTGTTSLAQMTPFVETPLVKEKSESPDEDFRLYASLYREAASSNSPPYQFLCYFKIIEGMRKRHARKAVEAKAQGLSPASRPREFIPSTPAEQQAWLTSLFPLKPTWDEVSLAEIFPDKALGRKVNDIIDKELTDIRNKVAHAVLDHGEPTVLVDEWHARDLLNDWMPMAKCIARALLRNEFPAAFQA